MGGKGKPNRYSKIRVIGVATRKTTRWRIILRIGVQNFRLKKKSILSVGSIFGRLSARPLFSAFSRVLKWKRRLRARLFTKEKFIKYDNTRARR